MKKLIYFLILGMLISGCAATSSRLNNLSLGMTKQEVIKKIGNPSSTKASEGVEVLEYMLYPCGGLSVCNDEPYWVTLRDNKVVQFGKAGDFGTAMPSDRRQYDITVHNK